MTPLIWFWIGSVLSAVAVCYAYNTGFEKGLGAGYEEGYFNRERAERKRRDAAGKFRTMEAD